MKRIILLLALVIIPSLLSAQPRCVKKFYRKYKHYEYTTNLKLGKPLLFVAAAFIPDDAGKQLFKKVNKFRLLVFQTGEKDNGRRDRDINKLTSQLEKESFSPLVQVRNAGDQVKIWAQDKGDKIKDLIVLAKDEDDLVFLSVTGNFAYSDISDLINQVQHSHIKGDVTVDVHKDQ